MTARQRGRRLFVSSLLLLASTSFLALEAQQSFAFSLDVHESILRAALPVFPAPAGVESGALSDIIGSFPAGTGSRGTDLDQFTAFKHFDNAENPSDVCARAHDAWAYYMPIIRSSVQPAGPDYLFLKDAVLARRMFGGLSHALQDFYSHSNWVDLAVASGQSPSLAPLFPICNPFSLPSSLHTGYFELSLANGVKGCPLHGGVPSPPPPFLYCHLTLAKDEPTSGHGKDPVPGSPGVTYHSLTAAIATAATTQLYQLVRADIASKYSPATNDISGDCVVDNLFAPAHAFPCLRLDGDWHVTRSDPTSGFPPLGTVRRTV